MTFSVLIITALGNHYSLSLLRFVMKIMICGPIRHGGVNKIKRLSQFLEENGFEIIKQFEKDSMDYSHLRDFRKKPALSQSIVEHDLQAVSGSDVLVVLSKPSFGAAMEMYVGKNLGKKIILFAEKSMPSPWPVKFSDYIVADKKSLVRILQKISKNKSQ